MNAIQRDKCFGRRLVTSGGDFGITYAAPARSKSIPKTVLATVPFIALAALVAFAIFR